MSETLARQIYRENWCAEQARKLAADYLPKSTRAEHRDFHQKLVQRFEAALRLATATTHPPKTVEE